MNKVQERTTIQEELCKIKEEVNKQTEVFHQQIKELDEQRKKIYQEFSENLQRYNQQREELERRCLQEHKTHHFSGKRICSRCEGLNPQYKPNVSLLCKSTSTKKNKG